MTARVGLDFSKCIQRQSNIGKTVYVDICDNKRVEVEWGSGDWLLFGGGLAIGLIVCVVFAALARMIWKGP